MPDSVAADARAMSELKQEAKRNRQLIHPRIVRVYDLLEDEKWAAVSMDYVQGETLAALQNKKAAAGLQSGRGLRLDLRTLPDLGGCAPGGPVPSRPGAGKSAGHGERADGAEIRHRASHSRFAGAQRPKARGGRDIAFMSPQQLDGERPSREDDIYSLGAVVYDLLTGVGPTAPGDLVSKSARRCRRAFPSGGPR